MLTLNKKSWVVRLAMFGSERETPSQISACVLFWMMVGGVVMGILYPFGITIKYTLIALGYVLGFFFAYRPVHLKSERNYERDLFVEYKSWPTVDGQKVTPFSVIVLGAILYGLVYGIVYLVGLCGTIPDYVWSAPTLIIVSGVIAFALAIWGMVRFVRSDFGKVTGEWLRAKKNKMCPMVRIIDPTDRTEADTQVSQ